MKTDYRFGEVKELASQVNQENEHVSFRNIFETDNGGVSLLAFKAGQELTEHVSPMVVMVNVLEGEVQFNMNGSPNLIGKGVFFLMGDEVPHSVVAKKESKVLLIKVKP